MRLRQSRRKRVITKIEPVSMADSYYRHLYQTVSGIAIVFASVLLGVGMFTFGAEPFGLIVRNILLGLFGIVGYLFPFAMFYFGIKILVSQNIDKLKIKTIYILVVFALFSCFLYIPVSSEIYNSDNTFFENVKSFYENGINKNGGGIIGGLLTVPLILVFGNIGTIIILLAGLIISFVILLEVSLESVLLMVNKVVIKIKWFVSRLLISKKRLELLKEKEKVNVKQEPKESKTDEHADKAINVNRTEKNKKVRDDNKKQEPQIEESNKDCNSEIEELELNHTVLNYFQDVYEFPPVELLKSGSGHKKIGFKKELREMAYKLEETLDSFGVKARVINICRGPTITRFELTPAAGVKVSRIVSLADDLALNLAVPMVRIEAPIPGKAAIGIEVPNAEVDPVYLRDIIESKEFKNHPSNLAFAIGKDIAGKIIIADIAKMPHLLIAGATGSGKSVCINALIMSILYKARPEQVKMLLIDPKVVELGIYNGIPHLLIPVVTDPRKAAGALQWAVQEMINRYNLFAEKGVRDINGYNTVLKEEGNQALLPQIVIIIDELADLMMVAPNDVEDAICRLAQMARAAGMHLVIATQRPSVDVITGVIKANIPSRISFAVSSQVDSRTILDMAGAEKLLGRGDMLYYPIGEHKPIRLQGALVSDKEVEAVVEFIKTQVKVEYDQDIIEKIEQDKEAVNPDPGDNDVLLPQAIELVVELGQASISILQRKFKIGYARAARLIDQMEARGIVGGFEGSKPRKVLITKQQWEEMKEK